MTRDYKKNGQLTLYIVPPLKYLIIYKIIIYIRIADGIFILMKQYPDESYHDSMILISKIRLPGSSLT